MDQQIRKKTLRLFSNGVYIMTARCGDDYGCATVTWVSQASFRPPLLMAAVRKESNVFKCMSRSGAAAIHVVSSDQAELAQRFFTPTRMDNGSINGEPFELGCTSAPILRSAVAYVECQVRRISDDLGDHAIVMLEVVDAAFRQPAHPLTIADSPWEYGG
jgi:flavin reductase (DIM6/NTAB) family NADH-FMN oxidoreductase RutF